MSQFQVKNFNDDSWKEIPESYVLEKLVDQFGRVTPIIIEMTQGKENITSDGIFRMKIGGHD
jgi:hypothetical protein